MEQVNKTELGDENIYPDEKVLRKVLGISFNAYSRLLDIFNENGMTYEWRYYRDGKAWLCKVQKKKKTIIWMSAWKDFMKATIYFPDRYTESLYDLNIKEDKKEQITTTKKVGKSIPFMFEIKNEEVLNDLETVMKYKISLK